MRWRVLGALFGVVAAFAGCSPTPPADAPQFKVPPHTLEPPFGGAPTLPPPDMTDDGAGSLVRVEPLADAEMFEIADATAVRMVYRSTTAGGEPTEVSGVVVVPPGSPPRGGWPIISFGHAVTGLDERCAPSRASNLGGYAGTVASLLQRGYVVAMSDYHGLGVTGYAHSVVDTETLGHNIIDAAGAARRVLPTASTKWAAFGTGEGGLAAWAAAELAGGSAGGMELIGAVALSPFADLAGLAAAAQQGNLTKDQNQLYMQVLQSLANQGAPINLDDYRSGVAAESWTVMINCGEPKERLLALNAVQPQDLRPADDAAAVTLQEQLQAAALPIESLPPAVAPVLVVYGTEDQTVFPQWVQQAVSAACGRGDSVEVMQRTGESSGTNYITIQMALNWLQARLSGQRMANTCGGAG